MAKDPTDVMGSPPSRVQEWIDQAASVTGVPSRLIQTIMYAESKYNPFPNDGGSGEIGPMQLMPEVWQQYTQSERQVRDPRINILIGAKHLKGLMDMYGGDLQEVMTAYNGSGPDARTYGRNAMRLYSGKPSPGYPLPQDDAKTMAELTARAQGKWPGQFTEQQTRPGATAMDQTPPRQAPTTQTTPSLGTSGGGQVWLKDPQGKHWLYPSNKAYGFLREHPLWKADLSYIPVKQQRQALATKAGGLWNRLNTGLISPEQLFSAVGRADVSGPMTLAGATQPNVLSRDQIGSLARLAAEAKRTGQPRPYTGPRISAPEARYTPLTLEPTFFWPQMNRAMAEFVSSGTSPASLATMGAGVAARGLRAVPAGLGALSTIARRVGTGLRGAQTLQELGYGAKGVYDMLGGAYQGFTQGWSPEVIANILTGGAQAAGAAPGAVEAKQLYRRNVKEALSPSLKLYGEDALIAAVGKKNAEDVRAAWRDVGSDIIAKNPKDLPEAKNVAEEGKLAAAQEAERMVNAASPGAGMIDPTKLVRSIKRKFVTASMLREPQAPSKFLDPEIEALVGRNGRLNAVEDKVRRTPGGITMSRAEAMIQGLNDELVQYYQLSDEGRHALGTRGQYENAFRKAWHDALQEQMDAKMSGYKAVKVRYGSYKDLARAFTDRLNELHASMGQENYTRRRIMSDFWGALGGSLMAFAVNPHPTSLIMGALGGGGLGHGYGELKYAGVVHPELLLRQAMRTGRPAPPVYGMRNLVQPLAAGLQTAYRKRELQDLAGELEKGSIRRPGVPTLVWPPPQQ